MNIDVFASNKQNIMKVNSNYQLINIKVEIK